MGTLSACGLAPHIVYMQIDITVNSKVGVPLTGHFQLAIATHTRTAVWAKPTPTPHTQHTVSVYAFVYVHVYVYAYARACAYVYVCAYIFRNKIHKERNICGKA